MRCYFDPRNPDVYFYTINLLNVHQSDISSDHLYDLGSSTIDYSYGKCQIPLWI